LCPKGSAGGRWQTPIEYLDPGHGESRLGYLWACARPGGDAVFTWQVSRAATCLESILPCGFRGLVQSDGYAAYPPFVRQQNARAGCEAITARRLLGARAARLLRSAAARRPAHVRL